MTVEVWGMLVTGVAALVAGPVFARERFRAAAGAERVLVLGPIFYAAALAVFAAEHFTAAHELMAIVPRWLPWPLFWTYFVGAAWLAAAISFIVWRQVRWSAALTALMLLIIVATISLPNLPKNVHDRFAWILTVRETAFASGAMVLAGSMWPRGSAAGMALVRVGRSIVAAVMIFYAVEHFLFPRFVPGVPLEKPMPAWAPAIPLSYLVGICLLAAGVGLFIPGKARISAAGCGMVLTLLTAFFYVPIFLMEMQSPTLGVEGLNYIFDTLLWTATVMLAGWGGEWGQAGDSTVAVRMAEREASVRG